MSAAVRGSSAGRSARDNYSCRSVMHQSGAEYAAVDAACRGTHEPVEMLLRCNGEREPSWSTDGHSYGPPAARRNSAHWWWNRQNRGWCRPDYPSRMRLRACGLLRPSSSGILRQCLETKPSTAILWGRVSGFSRENSDSRAD